MTEVSPAETQRLWVAREVASKRVQNGRLEIMSGEDRWAVVGAAMKAEERGEVHVIRRQPVLNLETNRYEIVVRRLREPRRSWFTWRGRPRGRRGAVDVGVEVRVR